jgi:molybdopterin molybdotransferase
MEMLSVAEAQTLVFKHAQALAPETTRLGPSALGLVLAEDVASDIDMPPFDKALMDGYAFRFDNLRTPGPVLDVAGEIMAGQTHDRPLGPREAVRIMTGAPVPLGADTVVMIERTRVVEGGRVEILDESIRSGANVLRLGREMRRGEVVLSRGAVLRPQELGLLATVGRTSVKSYPRPGAAIICTGDELVEAAEQPGPGHIRNGNGPMIAGLASRAGAVPGYLGIAKDDMSHLRELVGRGLESAVLILSGGVSAGKRDLVPAALEELHVQPHLHKVAMKPGKPVFFGTRGQTLVFGLPGNPVSSLVCFELFVRPALRVLAGHAECGPQVVDAVVQEEFTYRTDRPTYHPALLHADSAGWRVQMVPWFGSADLRGVTRCNSFAILPVGDNRIKAGQLQPVLRTDQ